MKKDKFIIAKEVASKKEVLEKALEKIASINTITFLNRGSFLVGIAKHRDGEGVRIYLNEGEFYESPEITALYEEFKKKLEGVLFDRILFLDKEFEAL